MFNIQNYAAFILTILVFQLVPGAGTLAILNATARHGLGAGFGAVAGTLLGDSVYMVAATLGLAAIISTHPFAFELLQWSGSAYLCWLGLKLLWSSVASDEPVAKPKQNRGLCFRQSCMVSLTNPKVLLFFMVLFPLFLPPAASPMTLLTMMAHVTIISSLYLVSLVIAGNAITRRLSTCPSLRRFSTRFTGVALIGFGIKLAGNR